MSWDDAQPGTAGDSPPRPGGPRGDEGPASGRTPPKRVLVTSPRTRAARRPRRPVTREIDEQTGLGEAYMRSLMRAQLRLSLGVCGLLGAAVGGLPLLFVLVPRLRELQVLGLPLPWLLLAGLVYPAFVGCGWWYVHQAERNERDFAELVDRDT